VPVGEEDFTGTDEVLVGVIPFPHAFHGKVKDFGVETRSSGHEKKGEGRREK
jgi:hypothetical protein